MGGLLLARSHGVERLGLCRRKSDPDNQIFDMLFKDLSTRHEGEALLHGEGAMVVKFLLFLVAALVASPAVGQVVTDGDTLKIGGTIYRLWGIDAPEAKQTCPDGWPAGSLAATRLQALTAGRSIVCQEKDRDRYGRIVAICRASGEDLGAIMVREGLAWAFVRYSSDYVGQEGRAKQARLGVHAHDCSPAWEWRAQQRVNGRQ